MLNKILTTWYRKGKKALQNRKMDCSALPTSNQTHEQARVYPLGTPTKDVPEGDYLELQLTKMWSEVLGIQPIGVKNDFFDLGGQSLQAVDLFAQIEKTYGKKLPLATLLQAPTIEQLANILRQEECSVPCESLVAIQPNGDKKPLFCIHGSHGNVLFFQKWGIYLGSNQPIYALQAQGVDGKQAPRTSIKDMAASYIKQIRTVQPKGPYLLVGFSSGGIVAFEMAQQLQAQGEKLALLALLDTSSPIYYKPLSFRQWFSRHLRELLRLAPKDKLTYFVAGMQERLQKIAHKGFYLGIGRFLPQAHKTSTQTATSIVNNQAVPENVVFTAQRQALKDYVAQVYSGEVILWRCVEQPWWWVNELQLGWGDLVAGKLEIQDVPGNHFTMFDEPYVGVIAEKLQACLDRVQADD